MQIVVVVVTTIITVNVNNSKALPRQGAKRLKSRSQLQIYKTRVNGLAGVKRDDSVLLLFVPAAEQAGRAVVVGGWRGGGVSF